MKNILEYLFTGDIAAQFVQADFMQAFEITAPNFDLMKAGIDGNRECEPLGKWNQN